MIKRNISLLRLILLAIILFLFLSACQGAVESKSTEPVSKAEPVDAEPVEAETIEADPQAEPVDAEPVETESAEPVTEAEPVEAVPVEAVTVEAGPQAEPVEAEPVEAETKAEPVEQRTWTTQVFSVTAADGLEIAGMATLPDSGDPVPAVLLLHMLGSNQQAWLESDLLTTLNDRGYATITVDMRGHGATGGTNDWDLAETDLQLVWQYLRDLPQIDGEAVAVIGASIGANMALRLAANVPQIDTAVLLSPGLDYRGVTTNDALANYGERPLFYIVAEGDGYANESVTTLYAQTLDPKQVEKLGGSAHGTRMLTAEPALSEMIVSWLNEHVLRGD